MIDDVPRQLNVAQHPGRYCGPRSPHLQNYLGIFVHTADPIDIEMRLTPARDRAQLCLPSQRSRERPVALMWTARIVLGRGVMREVPT